MDDLCHRSRQFFREQKTRLIEGRVFCDYADLFLVAGARNPREFLLSCPI